MSDIRVDWALNGWKQSKYAKNTSAGLLIDTDGYYGGQCKDFVNAFFANFVNWIPSGNAIDLISQSLPEAVERLSNPKQSDFKIGDVFVMKIGRFDHTGVIIAITPSGFVSVDQNWFNANDAAGSPPAQVVHGYTSIACLLRIKPGQGAGKEEMVYPNKEDVKMVMNRDGYVPSGDELEKWGTAKFRWPEFVKDYYRAYPTPNPAATDFIVGVFRERVGHDPISGRDTEVDRLEGPGLHK
jgi:hypothetical protein